MKKTSRNVGLTAAALVCFDLDPVAYAAVVHKGVQAWGYIQNNRADDGGSVTFNWSDGKPVSTSPDAEKMLGEGCWDNLGDRKSQMIVKMLSDGKNWTRVADVNNETGETTMTGPDINLDGGGQVMGNIWPVNGGFHQSTIIDEGVSAATFGMYASLDPQAVDEPLDGHDQVYAYLTDDMTTWMGDLRAQGVDAWDGLTLNDLVLPGAHDAGMWTLADGVNDAAEISVFLTGIADKIMIFDLGEKLVAWGTQGAVNVMQNAALTQKESTTDQLRLGIRYFDYRPAALKIPIVGIDLSGYYHVHSFIPGYNFQSFLSDVTAFLATAPDEIVMVNIKSSGIQGALFDPIYDSDVGADPVLADSVNIVKGLLTDVGFDSANAIYEDDFSNIQAMKLGDLISDDTRLIFYFGTGYNDSYPDDATGYDTYDPSSVTGQLDDTVQHCTEAPGKYTVFQLQDTATDWIWPDNLVSGPASSALLSVNGSVTLSTKGLFDNQTYPWVIDNLVGCTNMAVTLNDFAGNLLALNAKRLMEYKVGINSQTPKLARQSCTNMGD